jgi:hypothetical protein
MEGRSLSLNNLFESFCLFLLMKKLDEHQSEPVLAQTLRCKPQRYHTQEFIAEMIWEQPILLHLLLLERTDIESSLLKAQFFGCYEKQLFLFLFSKKSSRGATFDQFNLRIVNKGQKLQLLS